MAVEVGMVLVRGKARVSLWWSTGCSCRGTRFVVNFVFVKPTDLGIARILLLPSLAILVASILQHVCIFGTDIDVFENRTILMIVGVFGDLRRCTGLQHDARTRSAREITVGDASRGGVANCL